jgi:hypothetical protein
LQIDVFNGDADGICGLHQFRLAHPCESQLISGAKRDVKLLARVDAGPGDSVAVFDISLDSNRLDLDRLLARGVPVQYFDHHDAGELPECSLFRGHIDTSTDVCTSIIVDRHLGGRFRPWAVAAAFGDNLPAAAVALAHRAGLDEAQQQVLKQLGECLNYNGYGDAVEDLFFHPVALYRSVSRYDDPLEFAASAPEMRVLADGFAADVDWMQQLRPTIDNEDCRIFVLPASAQARRVSGTLANRVALERPQLAHAVLTPNSRGTYTVSVRAPVSNPYRAQEVCRLFGGGGRHAAAGINDLQQADVERFGDVMRGTFARAPS